MRRRSFLKAAAAALAIPMLPVERLLGNGPPIASEFTCTTPGRSVQVIGFHVGFAPNSSVVPVRVDLFPQGRPDRPTVSLYLHPQSAIHCRFRESIRVPAGERLILRVATPLATDAELHCLDA